MRIGSSTWENKLQAFASSIGNHVPKPAELVPAGTGLVTIVQQVSDTDCPTGGVSDLDSLTSEADWETFDAYSNLRKFQYTKCTNELYQGRIDKGPPLEYVVVLQSRPGQMPTSLLFAIMIHYYGDRREIGREVALFIIQRPPSDFQSFGQNFEEA
jgi:hypothetical protein